MAPIARRRGVFGSLLEGINIPRDKSESTGNNFNYLRSLTATGNDLNSINIKKRRRSFKDTLRRNIKSKLQVEITSNDNDTDNGIADDDHHEIDNPDLWRTFQTCRPSNEHDLEHKIDLEIKMREGTTKLLAASHHPSQLLEAAKSLLTSNERMAVYLIELQRRKGAENTVMQLPPTVTPRSHVAKARMSVSDIRMPLIWKEGDHFKNKGDYRRFAVFCLLRVGTEIYDTAMINRVDRSMTDISFDDVFVFNQLPPDFQFQLEVYSHVLQDDLSIASTPRKIRHRINDSLSRTVGRKLAASVKDELNAAAEIGPKYELVAHAKLTLDDVSDNITTHDFLMENNENSHGQLPLYGHFCCRMAAQPDFLAFDQQLEDLHSGTLILKSVSTENEDEHLWAVIRSFAISLYLSSCHQNSEPQLRIMITKDTIVALADDLSFTITNVDEGLTITYHLTACTCEDRDRWVSELGAIVHNYDIWKHAATRVMEIYSPVAKRHPLFTVSRKPSLYELTSLKDSPVVTEFKEDVGPTCSSRSRSSSVSSTTTSSDGASTYNNRHSASTSISRKYRLSHVETSV